MRNTMSWDEFVEKLDKMEKSPFYPMRCFFDRIKDFFRDLSRNLKWSRLKLLPHFFKTWWDYFSLTEYDGLSFLHWHFTQVLKTSEKNHYYVNQRHYDRHMKIFIECLRRYLEEDYGDINKIGYEKYVLHQEENFEMMKKYMRTMSRWGI